MFSYQIMYPQNGKGIANKPGNLQVFADSSYREQLLSATITIHKADKPVI